MHALDFEEFLWAVGRDAEFICGIEGRMRDGKPFSDVEMDVMSRHFLHYSICGGMPAAVASFVANGNFSEVGIIQKEIVAAYCNDCGKYCEGLDSSSLTTMRR